MKNVLVTGGTRGIGKAIISLLQERGDYRILYTYKHNQDLAQEMDKLASEAGYPLQGYMVDVSVHEQVIQMLKEINEKWGKIDILINNAGITMDKPLALMSDEEWDTVIKTNLYGVYHLTRECIYPMMRAKQGRVINISSTSGITGIRGQCNYSSSKASIIGFTKSLAKEVANFGISVNCVAPGGVETEMTGKMSEAERKQLLVGVPMGRMCKAEEVAKVVAFLADEELCPSYLTGAVIPLDGGSGV